MAFHELFHFDHGPTLAAMLSTLSAQSRSTGRRLVLAMAPGFHFVSQAPFDAATMMASFLPQEYHPPELASPSDAILLKVV